MSKEGMQRMTCQIPGGLSVENAALIARIANTSNSHVTIEYKGNIYTAHSILKLLSIAVEDGELVIISACGKDAEETVGNIGKLFMEDDEILPKYVNSDSSLPSLV